MDYGHCAAVLHLAHTEQVRVRGIEIAAFETSDFLREVELEAYAPMIVSLVRPHQEVVVFCREAGNPELLEIDEEVPAYLWLELARMPRVMLDEPTTLRLPRCLVRHVA